MADDDAIESMAAQLRAAYYLDTKHESDPPPMSNAQRQAWRRVAALVIDMKGAR